MTTRAITYGRQSKKREDDSQTSPEAQRRSTGALITARGWKHVGHFEDVGRSGYDPGVSRPGLDAALDALRRGEADALVVYRLDRLTRQGVVEAARLVGEIADYGASLVSVQEQFLDTSTPMGRGIFGMFAALAEQESANISSRTRAAKATLRAAGSAAGGRPVFGMKAEKTLRDGIVVRDLVPEPREADVVREVVKRALNGESVRSLVVDLNRRGITTRQGKEWSTSTLTRLLRTPSLAGYMPEYRPGKAGQRVDNGRIAIQRAEDGSLLRPWAGVVSLDDWHRLQDVLDARPVTRGKSKTPSLFGGFLLRCFQCGSGMGADRRGDGRGSYRCMNARRGSQKCSGAAVSIEHTDRHVPATVFRRLASMDPENSPEDAALLAAATERFAARSGDGDAAERATLEAQAKDAREALDRLDDDRAAGLFSGSVGADRYARQVRAQTARLEAAQSALDALAPDTQMIPWLDPMLLGDEGPMGPGGFWEGLDLPERREFLGLFLDAVDVHKGRRGGGNAPFRADERLMLHWAG